MLRWFLIRCIEVVIVGALYANERVDLLGFRSLAVKEMEGSAGCNPRTGETITIAAKRDASFKPRLSDSDGGCSGIAV